MSAVQFCPWPPFFMLAAIPCTLFAATELLLPLASSAGTDWQSHLFSVRNWFFGVLFVFSVIATLETYVFLNVSLTHPYRVMQVALAGVVVTGFFVNNARTHVWLSVINFCGLLVGQVLFRFLPGLSQ